MAIKDTQLPALYRAVIDDQITVFKKSRSIQVRNTIPDTDQIPLDDQSHWLRIPDVVCVFVDMMGSTRLSATQHDKDTAGAYQLFTGTAVRLLHEFDAPYIDVRGDGAFALFHGDQRYRALAAAVSFKTFAKEEFVSRIKDLTGQEVGCHIGIDCQTVLVRKIGLRQHGGRSDRQNEVWAGKPVNMAAKLASRTEGDELLVSDRYYEMIPDDYARLSCGCGNDTGERTPLWDEIDVSDDSRFDFNVAHRLKSRWCGTHGAEYCERVLALDV